MTELILWLAVVAGFVCGMVLNICIDKEVRRMSDND